MNYIDALRKTSKKLDAEFNESELIIHSPSKGAFREYIVKIKKCLSPAKKYKLYKSSINKSIHFVQRSLSRAREGSVLLLSSTYQESEKIG